MTLWGGRFTKKMDTDAWELNASILFDKRLAKQDTQASIAWAKALEEIGVLTPAEELLIQDGLQQIQKELISENFLYLPEDEDIHTAVERRLFEIIGPTAGKLHTGRSRNDQVATDFRLWMMENILYLIQAIKTLQLQIFNRAQQDIGIRMPSYTHLQQAQPVLLSHWWLSFFWPLQRDLEQFNQVQKQASVLPLGSGAVAGTSFPIDRQVLANQLGFEAVSQNSMDAVSDRDFAAQFIFSAALCGVHLSRLAEQLIIFTSSEFGFFTLSDAFSTGSSLMPQKKNADIFELTRGKAGSMLGTLCGFLATLKGLPSVYDKDLQEDKQAVFKVLDTLMSILPVIGNAIQTLTVNVEKITATINPAIFATDIADGLVKHGIPFREAHAIVGKAIQIALDRNVNLDSLSDADWQMVAPGIALDWQSFFSIQRSIETRSVIGGTATSAVNDQIKLIQQLINA
ncbi:MAG: argininosuccinate lyase [Chloroflexi bacterium HGW-Chloroflexi-8]|nr:MAG: argininosuccinate lyase [Chloroflexi bacterium HGW-Chloroflexi-8]